MPQRGQRGDSSPAWSFLGVSCWRIPMLYGISRVINEAVELTSGSMKALATWLKNNALHVELPF
jgi:hypothetical protein